MTAVDTLSLLDYRRRVVDLYRDVRDAPPGEKTWRRWCAARDHLFSTHSESAIPQEARESFAGLSYFPYDPGLRVLADVASTDAVMLEISHSSSGSSRFLRVGEALFILGGVDCSLDVFWLDSYGGGLFLPFKDRTSGDETYGGGRYLLDTAKGADLGAEDGRLILDFNYAFHPSCVHSSEWSCPLAPPSNHLPVSVRGGERL